MRALNELRDPWAIAFAQAAAFVTYFLFAAPLWQSALAAAAVLGARVVAGVTIGKGKLDPNAAASSSRMTQRRRSLDEVVRWERW